ncbi:VanW family protein [Orenia marismortui]|uniref:VanW like protein n=1 Tax=Orenia marismortui TaxID=46469 RepID=A0A4V3GX63_9FIRM|nr:VanW family protein [Orenia marismortui]TDX46619.1 VanW like protein [Orenia marismortui]
MAKRKGSMYTIQRGLIILIVIILIGILILGLVAEVDKLLRIIWGVEENVYFENQDLSRYLRSEVESLLYYYSKDSILYPVNATIDHDSGEIVSESYGEIIDITATGNRIFEVEKNSKIKEIKYKIKPYLYKEDIEKINKKIGNYTTTVRGSDGRKENIKLASELINNRLLLSGEVFSFNKVVGPRTKEKGFKEAPEIINGELSLGIGGGICQVSSTLFNALKADEFQIIERHIHSKDITYVPDGKDVAVAWDYLDFKFKNNFSSPIIIKSKVIYNQLTINILGSLEDD